VRRAHARLKPLTVAGNGDSEPLSSASLSLTDYSGRKRQGHALLLSEWPSNPGSERLAEGEDFRIVVLSEPPEGAISPEEGVVVVAPACRLASATVTEREPTATHSAAEQADLTLSAKNIELLRQGRLLAATPLQLTAEDVFAGGKARLAFLACDLLLSIAVAEYLSPIAIALSAPDAAKPVTQDRLEELKQLVSAVQQVLRNSNDARVDQFLKVVQASQLSSLSDILDDDLIGYLRRFLVESRIETALRPIFDQLQEGVTPKVDEAKTAMREVSQVLQRAFQAAQRALPPAETTVTDSPRPRRKRKR
jgi:hypothetical protein